MLKMEGCVISFLMQLSLTSSVYSYSIAAKLQCRINKNCNDCSVLSSFDDERYSNISELGVAAVENKWEAVDFLIGIKLLKINIVDGFLFQEMAVTQIIMELLTIEMESVALHL